MDEEVLNQSLLPLFGIEEDAFLAYDNPVKADEVQETNKRLSYVQGGILTANEAREMEGLEKSGDPNADRLLIGGQPLGGAPAPAASPFAIGTRPQQPTTAPSAPPAGEAIADTALNGAQVTSLVDLATAVGVGQLPKDTAIAIAASAFPAIASEQIRAMFDPIPDAPAQTAAQPRQDAALTFGTATDTETKSIETKDALGDCVSAKIPKLLDEGYEQDQAVAIAYSMCSGKGLEESIGKAVSDIDTKPPGSVAQNARRALEVRETKPESERGMTEIGIARARDLANRANLSEDTIRRMVAYFERHQSDKQGETWDDQGKGWQAWNGWGGDDGWSWAKAKVEEFDRARAKKSCGCGCASRKTVKQSEFVGKHASDLGAWLKVKSAEKEADKRCALAVHPRGHRNGSRHRSRHRHEDRPDRRLRGRARRPCEVRGDGVREAVASNRRRRNRDAVRARARGARAGARARRVDRPVGDPRAGLGRVSEGRGRLVEPRDDHRAHRGHARRADRRGRGVDLDGHRHGQDLAASARSLRVLRGGRQAVRREACRRRRFVLQEGRCRPRRAGR